MSVLNFEGNNLDKKNFEFSKIIKSYEGKLKDDKLLGLAKLASNYFIIQKIRKYLFPFKKILIEKVAKDIEFKEDLLLNIINKYNIVKEFNIFVNLNEKTLGIISLMPEKIIYKEKLMTINENVKFFILKFRCVK